ncbi:hypothetical protein PPEP_b0740 [Pseudoalteromonas peptidolytica F12-50-A1]|uniref:Uncharacterized protein n=1 Tax=Pseudoalteromonas peptidolytica F12-50-A1 TaxID=1315280 RepID=A0A8I0N1K7_9GAMM|nr:hypothetical protein [Pseudoalteromonas peptidolytica F12-50-A1]
MSITRQKFYYLVVLNEKFLTLLASDLLLQIEQVLSQIGITIRVMPVGHHTLYLSTYN